VEFAVADQVKRFCHPSAQGPGMPVVPVNAGSRHHLPATHWAKSQVLSCPGLDCRFL
jgi:hypothetical protein